VSAEPQPNAAAILDTLNEIARELEDGAKKQPPESPGEMSIRLEKPGNRATGAVMPRVGMERLTEPVARPRSSGRRVVVGVFVALAYVAILAVAGLFISRAVNPIASGSPGASLGSQASAAISALVAKIDTVLHRRGGAAAPEPVGSAAVSAPIEAPPSAEAVPLNPAVPPAPAMVESPRRDAVETEISTPATAPAPPAVPSKGIDQTAPASPPAAMPAPAAVTDTATVSAPPKTAPPPSDRVEAAAPATQAPPPPPAPAVEAPRAAAAETAPPPAAIAPPAPAKSASTPADPSAGQALRALGDERLRQGDIASARLFYERAADAGNARAALMMGGTYDASFLERLGVLGMQGDPAQAASWYRRARELGEPEADTRLQTLPQK
jgi:hypothetical protein